MKRTTKTFPTVALAALLLTIMAWAADNPLKKAKVGEWIEFATHAEVMGQTRETTMKQTVVAKDAVSVTMRTVTTMMGREMPPQDVKIMLDKPYEPYKSSASDAVVTQLGEGSETIIVRGKSYNCHWVKVKTVETKPQAVESVTKVWGCKDVPVSGMVKMEIRRHCDQGRQNREYQDDHGAHRRWEIAASGDGSFTTDRNVASGSGDDVGPKVRIAVGSNESAVAPPCWSRCSLSRLGCSPCWMRRSRGAAESGAVLLRSWT